MLYHPVDFSERGYFLRIIAILLLLMFVWIQTCLAAPADTEHSDLARLMTGEILVQTVHEEKSGGAAKVTALFHTDMDKIWEVVGYCEHEFVYVRGLEFCQILETSSFYTKKRHRVNNNWYTPTIDFTFEASRQSVDHGEFRLVEGNLKVLEGQWSFEQLTEPGVILVTHEIRVRSRFPAPRWLVRRVLKKDLPNMLACVRGLAGASGDTDRIADDMNRCPGDIDR